MADATQIDVDAKGPTRSGGRAALLIGLVVMLALGGAGFWSTYSGVVAIPVTGGSGGSSVSGGAAGETPVAFVPLETLTVTLGPSARSRHLRLGVTLEVAPEAKEEVTRLKPRVLDVLNTYLQAIDERDVEKPAALARIRAHMLRRIQIVTGPGRVQDLLVTEFVLN